MKKKRKRHVLIGIVCLRGQPELETALALADTLRHLSELGVEAEIHTRIKDGILPRARNSLVASFLKSNATDLVNVDDDLAWRATDFARLLSHPVDCVGGTYRFKRDDEAYPVNMDPDLPMVATKTGLLRVRDVPTGFLRLTRKCIETMVNHPLYAGRRYYDRVADAEAWALFDFEHEFYEAGQQSKDRTGYRGEDYVFCRRWRAIGGDVFVDPELRLDHIGKKNFSGCFGEFLGGKNWMSKEQAAAA